VLQAVAELVTPTDTGEAMRFTASAGIIHTSQAVRHTPESMIHQADLALYRAKQLGRNRVEAAGEVIPQA
jgi:PleD family two-component response regulator